MLGTSFKELGVSILNSEFHRSVAKGMALLGVALVLVCWGPAAHDANVLEDLTQRQHMTALKVPAESLQTQFTAEPHYVNLMSGGKGYSYVVGYDWVRLETRDWTFLNGRYATTDCPALLKGFIETNAPQQHLALDGLKKLMAAHKETPVTLSAYVPRFSAQPPALRKCSVAGIGYDTQKGLLTMYGKPLAILADLRLRESDR
jgi:hypothetical protein